MTIYTCTHLKHLITQDRNSRFSAVGCQTEGARVRLLNLTITHQMAPPRHAMGYCVATHLSTPKGRKTELA